jgi:hypothetical protein
VTQANEAKKEREERNRQWANLMQEIAASNQQVADPSPPLRCLRAQRRTQIASLQADLGVREKEVKYLKRALESVYSRFRSQEATTPTVLSSSPMDLDADTLATRTLEALSHRDQQITQLQSEIATLRQYTTPGQVHLVTPTASTITIVPSRPAPIAPAASSVPLSSCAASSGSAPPAPPAPPLPPMPLLASAPLKSEASV